MNVQGSANTTHLRTGVSIAAQQDRRRNKFALICASVPAGVAYGPGNHSPDIADARMMNLIQITSDT
jgi:hypothetical protein